MQKRIVAYVLQSGRAHYNGSLDPISPRKDVLALYGAASRPKTLRWYRSTHRLPAAATAFRDGWLLSHLR